MYCIQGEDGCIVFKERMEVLYTRWGWSYCIQGEDECTVYEERMDVLNTRWGWRYCIQGKDGGIEYKERMEVLYTRRGWRYCIQGRDGGFVYKEGMEVLRIQEDHFFIFKTLFLLWKLSLGVTNTKKSNLFKLFYPNYFFQFFLRATPGPLFSISLIYNKLQTKCLQFLMPSWVMK